MTARPVAMFIPGLILCCVVAANAQASPCSCADKQDLLNRLNLIEAAILEYREQIVGMTNREKIDGKPLMVTPELYKEILQDRVNDALKRIKDPKARTGTAQTNGGDCTLMHVTAPTACLRETLTRHEAIHISSCKAYEGAPGFHKTYQTRMRLIDFAREEITAYLEERAFILQQLKKLPTTCRPNNWFGFVEYQTLKRTESNIIDVSIPNLRRPSAGLTIKEGGNRSQKTERGYFGTILVEDGRAATARADAVATLDDVSRISGRVFCNYTKAPDVRVTDTTSDAVNLSGEGSGTASFKVTEAPAKNSYTINIKFFPVNIAGSRISTSSPPACKGGAPKTYASSPTDVIIPSPYTIKGTITNKDFFSGSNSELPASGQHSNNNTTTSPTGSTSTSSSISYTIKTRWMLRRLTP